MFSSKSTYHVFFSALRKLANLLGSYNIKTVMSIVKYIDNNWKLFLTYWKGDILEIPETSSLVSVYREHLWSGQELWALLVLQWHNIFTDDVDEISQLRLVHLPGNHCWAATDLLHDTVVFVHLKPLNRSMWSAVLGFISVCCHEKEMESHVRTFIYFAVLGRCRSSGSKSVAVHSRHCADNLNVAQVPQNYSDLSKLRS